MISFQNPLIVDDEPINTFVIKVFIENYVTNPLNVKMVLKVTNVKRSSKN